eukprot:Hpha_TRINITY_DN27764_c0_g1::TRINITY_DN27764_c0_g1_i1::g.157026::m.157026
MPGAHAGKHQNKEAWIPHKHQKHLRIAERENLGSYTNQCCPRCTQQLEWRKRYGKYKGIERPTRCHGCNERKVVRAYHQLCTPCAKSKSACAKCEGILVPDDETVAAEEAAQKEKALLEVIATLPLRFRKSAERRIQRGEAFIDVETVVERGLRKMAEREAAKSHVTGHLDDRDSLSSDSDPGEGRPRAARPPEPDSDSDEVIDSDED